MTKKNYLEKKLFNGFCGFAALVLAAGISGGCTTSIPAVVKHLPGIDTSSIKRLSSYPSPAPGPR